MPNLLTPKRIAELVELYEQGKIGNGRTLAERQWAQREFQSAIGHAFLPLIETLAGKDAALLAEQKDHQLTIDTFRRQGRIWEQKLAEKLVTELDAMKIEIESKLTVELQQANERVRELESLFSPPREDDDDNEKRSNHE